MDRRWRTARVAVVLGSAAQSSGSRATMVPAFFEADRCYRLTFTIAAAPNWKVLEVVDGTWIRAEIDAGPASATREPLWVNTALVVTARTAPCGE
jgi:hypothetical protein